MLGATSGEADSKAIIERFVKELLSKDNDVWIKEVSADCNNVSFFEQHEAPLPPENGEKRYRFVLLLNLADWKARNNVFGCPASSNNR